MEPTSELQSEALAFAGASFFLHLIMRLSAPTALERRVRDLALPIVEELGLVIYELEVLPSSQRGAVKVFLDREGASGEPGKGVTIGEIAQVSKQLGYLLDVEDVIAFDYNLEVSSPGVERELKRPEHFQALVGVDVRVVTSEPVEEQSVFEGTLTAADDDAFEVTVGKQSPTSYRIEYVHVRRAKTVYDFGKANGAQKGSKKKKNTKKR